MTEEQVTKALLRYLTGKGWEILCFDFPQSGTGVYLHPDEGKAKNLGAIVPDIVAFKAGLCLCFENKDRAYLPDFQKAHRLQAGGAYRQAFARLLAGRAAQAYRYGIGLPTESYDQAASGWAALVDFVLGVNADGTITQLHGEAI